MFSLAPAVSEHDDDFVMSNQKKKNSTSKTSVDFPKSILKQSPLHSSMNVSRTNLKRVSINLPDNEISLANIGSVSSRRSQVPARSPVCFPFMTNMDYCDEGNVRLSSSRSILEVLREIDADVVALCSLCFLANNLWLTNFFRLSVETMKL
ncbi:unnamed protein product [Lathyrus sativus]|nr:unnamed protein product [Lathyrus sativus]